MEHGTLTKREKDLMMFAAAQALFMFERQHGFTDLRAHVMHKLIEEFSCTSPEDLNKALAIVTNAITTHRKAVIETMVSGWPIDGMPDKKEWQ